MLEKTLWAAHKAYSELSKDAGQLKLQSVQPGSE